MTLEPPELGRSARPSAKPGRGVARLDLPAKPRVRILLVSDLHMVLGGERGDDFQERDEHTVEDLAAHVRRQRPDLLICNGDSWHDNPDGRGKRAMGRFLEVVTALKTPWALTWGNHDELDDYQAGHDALEAAPHSLYRGGGTHGDYRIEVRADGAVALDLLLLNSHWEGIGPWQRAWLDRTLKTLDRRPGPTPPALAFFHIPLRDLATLHKAGVTPGPAMEAVCYEKEDGSTVGLLQRGGRVRATFSGHDHTNDYSVQAGSVTLCYDRSTGYSGYGGDRLRKGAKVIDLDVATGKIAWRTVFAQA